MKFFRSPFKENCNICWIGYCGLGKADKPCVVPPVSFPIHLPLLLYIVYILIEMMLGPYFGRQWKWMLLVTYINMAFFSSSFYISVARCQSKQQHQTLLMDLLTSCWNKLVHETSSSSMSFQSSRPERFGVGGWTFLWRPKISFCPKTQNKPYF